MKVLQRLSVHMKKSVLDFSVWCALESICTSTCGVNTPWILSEVFRSTRT